MNEATALQVQETALSVEETRQKAQLEAVKQIISQRTPDKEIRTRKGRGGMVFKYTDGAYVIRTLNEALGHNWDFEADNEEVINWQGVPFEVRCRGRLTVRLNGQAVTKVQYGSQLIEFVKERDKQGNVVVVAPVSIGDCFKGAATDAMKKCASLFGLALDLYDSDFKAENYAEDQPDDDVDRYAQAARDPQAKTLGDLVTPKQLYMIRNMAREQGLDAEQICIEKFQCPIEEISKKAASVIIDQLKANTGNAEIEQEPARRNAQAEKLRPVAAPANGPSRKAVFDRKHSPGIGARFDELVRQLVARGIKGDELLREANVALHDSGRKQIKTRYEADDEGAAIICNTFEAWIMNLDRKAKDIGI